uniref:AT-rich interaction domain 5A n=2 Tax=Sphenodon punctatus TaxID=8508 RepID=A0A8D0GEQ0_SPHPU
MEECESQKASGLGPVEETSTANPGDEGSPSTEDWADQMESPAVKPDDSSEMEQKIPAEEIADGQTSNCEREEEQAFLVDLYKFMKERHTPIERVPHLGFKQINLWKIYKAVEKLGAYELVTGRRLWKNVYDMLGGSPGSTSSATCTRRHYERLVLPYVRHLKGEDDKPLPPVKPRKQYKVSKEPKGDKGDDSVEKTKKAKKEKNSRDQVLPEKVKSDAIPVPKTMDVPEQSKPGERTEGFPLPNSKDSAENQPPSSCHGSCKSHCCSETYKRLFSSFYFKGSHGIMSPLAKKKLLAQVSKAESLHCHEKHLSHCPEGKKARTGELSCSSKDSDPNRPSVIHHHEEGRSPQPEEDNPKDPVCSSHLPGTGEGASCPKGSPSPRDSHMPQRAEDGNLGCRPSPAPSVFTGYFHAYRSEVVKPVSCHPLRSSVERFPDFKDFQESSSSIYRQPGKDQHPKRQDDSEEPGEQPEDLRSKASRPRLSWSGDTQRPSAFHKGSPGEGKSSPFPSIKACWVPPMTSLAKASPQLPKNSGLVQPIPQSRTGSPALGSGQRNKRSLEEEGFVHGKKLKAVLPFIKEAEPKDRGVHEGSPSAQQGLAKPKVVMPSPGFSAATVPQIQDVYKGTMFRFPVNFGNPADHLKGQSSPLIPSLSIRPFVIPAFPSHLLATSAPSSDLCRPLATSLVHYPTSYDSSQRHRLYPVSTWHNQPTYAAPHGPSFHRNTKL